MFRWSECDTNLLVRRLGILVCMSQGSLYVWYLYIPPFKFESHLHYCFLFKFVLLCHILVGYTNIFLCERLIFNLFSHTFVHLTIVVLNSYDSTSWRGPTQYHPFNIILWYTAKQFLLFRNRTNSWCRAHMYIPNCFYPLYAVSRIGISTI